MIDDDQGLGDLVHPSDARPTPAGDYVCTFDDCNASFDNAKALSLHETGSHTFRHCRICGDRVGLRGISRHEATCVLERSGAFDDMLPDEAMRARLRDFLERSNEPVERDDVYCVTCDDGEDPAFVLDRMLGDWIDGKGMCFTFPARDINPKLFAAAPKRDRRTGQQAVDREPGSKVQHDMAPLIGFED